MTYLERIIVPPIKIHHIKNINGDFYIVHCHQRPYHDNYSIKIQNKQ